MGKTRRDRPARRLKPIELFMAVLGVGFLLLVILVVVLLLTHGCSVVHYPLDLDQRM